MKIYMIIIILVLLGAFFIVSQHNLSLNNKQDREEFLKLYLTWLDDLLGNAQYLSGYVIQMDWLPYQNSTNSTRN